MVTRPPSSSPARRASARAVSSRRPSPTRRVTGAVTLTGACLALGDGTIPYLPFAEVLRDLAGSVPARDLDRILGSAREELARLVPDLASEPWRARPALVVTGASAARPAAGATARETPAALADGSDHALADASAADLATEPAPGVARARLFEAVLGVLGRLGERDPAVIAIEDVHWADPATRDLVTFLVRNLTRERIALVLTVRTDDAIPDETSGRWLAELGRDPRFERLEVIRLAHDDVAAQVGAILGRAPAGDLLRPIWERSDGNPFFVEALVAATAGGDGTALPGTLVEVLGARLADLPDDARRTLEALAILVRPSDEAMIGAVIDLPEAASGMRCASVWRGTCWSSMSAGGCGSGTPFWARSWSGACCPASDVGCTRAPPARWPRIRRSSAMTPPGWPRPPRATGWVRVGWSRRFARRSMRPPRPRRSTRTPMPPITSGARWSWPIGCRRMTRPIARPASSCCVGRRTCPTTPVRSTAPSS